MEAAARPYALVTFLFALATVTSDIIVRQTMPAAPVLAKLSIWSVIFCDLTSYGTAP